MGKVLIAVDESKGSPTALRAFRDLIQKPRTVVLVTVQRLLGDSLIIDMLGDAERDTLRQSLKGTEHQDALDSRAELLLARYARELHYDGVAVKTVVRAGPPAEEDPEGRPGGGRGPHHHRPQLQKLLLAAPQGLGEQGYSEERHDPVPGREGCYLRGAINAARNEGVDKGKKPKAGSGAGAVLMSGLRVHC